MKKYLRTYRDAIGLSLHEPLKCELFGLQRTEMIDVHHIEAPGMGSNNRDEAKIENLMAIIREAHIKVGDIKQYKELLKEVHYNFLRTGNALLEVDPHNVIFNEFESNNALWDFIRKQRLLSKF